MISLLTLQNPCIIPGLVPTGLRDLLVSSDILLDATSFFRDTTMIFAVEQEKHSMTVFEKSLLHLIEYLLIY